MYLLLCTFASALISSGAAENITCDKLDQCNLNRTPLDEMTLGLLQPLNSRTVYDKICKKQCDAFSSCMKNINTSLCPNSRVITYFKLRTQLRRFLCSKEARKHVEKLPGSECMNFSSAAINKATADILKCPEEMDIVKDRCQINEDLRECIRKAFYDNCGPDYGFLGTFAYLNFAQLGPVCQ